MINDTVSKGKRVGISVIIPTYNRNQELCRVLSRLFEQNDQAEEIIVVDQSLRHDLQTQNVLEGLVKEGKIRLIFQSPPSLPRARNRGILEARHEVILCIDDDADFDNDFIRMHRMSYDEQGVDGVAGAMVTQKLTEFSLVDTMPSFALNKPWGWLNIPLNYSKKIRRIFMVGCNFSIKREIALKVRGFDENYIWPALCEDNDFSWRVHKAKAVIVYNPSCLVSNITPHYGGCYFKRDSQFSPVTRELINNIYFFLVNSGLRFALLGWLRYYMKTYVYNKHNLCHPRFFFIAAMRYFVATLVALFLVLKGRRLIKIETNGRMSLPSPLFIFRQNNLVKLCPKLQLIFALCTQGLDSDTS